MKKAIVDERIIIINNDDDDDVYKKKRRFSGRGILPWPYHSLDSGIKSAHACSSQRVLCHLKEAPACTPTLTQQIHILQRVLTMAGGHGHFGE